MSQQPRQRFLEQHYLTPKTRANAILANFINEELDAGAKFFGETFSGEEVQIIEVHRIFSDALDCSVFGSLGLFTIYHPEKIRKETMGRKQFDLDRFSTSSFKETAAKANKINKALDEGHICFATCAEINQSNASWFQIDEVVDVDHKVLQCRSPQGALIWVWHLEHFKKTATKKQAPSSYLITWTNGLIRLSQVAPDKEGALHLINTLAEEGCAEIRLHEVGTEVPLDRKEVVTYSYQIKEA